MGGTVFSQVVGYYMGNKNDSGSGGSISPPAGDIGPPLSSTWVPDGVENTLGKMGILTVGGVVKCRVFPESWVLVSMWFSPHYYMYQTGILTFGPSSKRTGDLGTRNLVTLAKRTQKVGKTGPFVPPNFASMKSYGWGTKPLPCPQKGGAYEDLWSLIVRRLLGMTV